METRPLGNQGAFLGTSGWDYKHWAGGVFYPPGLPQAARLEFYAGNFDSVEVDSTFYRLPEERVFREWHDRTPESFTFAVKANRFITHLKKLKEPEQHVARFLTHAAGLREKLGVVLFQLPPFWKFNATRLDALLAFMRAQKITPRVRAAVEVRHPSWQCDECFEILRHHHTALVFSDLPGCVTEGPETAEFTFIRRHGTTALYASGYPSAALRRDAANIRAWLARGRDVHVYFNNDAGGCAVRDARRLGKYLSRPTRVKTKAA